MDPNTSSPELYTENKPTIKEAGGGILRIAVLSMLLSAVILALYWQVIHFEFVNFDDPGYVVNNFNVHKGLSLDSIKWAFHPSMPGDKNYWHPLTWLSHMLDYQLFGLNAGMHHLSSVIYHILNTILLFITLWLFSRSTWKSFFAAMLFAIHPVNVDSVAWIAERKNLLSTFFWLLTMLFYYYYTRRPNLNRYLILLTIFILGLLSKPMLVTLPFVLLLLDFWPLNRINAGGNIKDILKSIFNRNNLNLVLEKLPLMALSVAMILYNAQAVVNIGGTVSIEGVPIDLRFKNAIISYVLYLKKLVWPFDLTFFYPYPTGIPMWEVGASLAFIIIVTAIALKYIKEFPYIIFGWLWFIGTIVPVSGIMQGGLWPQIAERWAYVPFIGMFIIISWGISDILKKLQKKEIIACMAALIIILPLAARTWDQIGYWKNDFTLFRHAIKINDNDFVAHTNLGISLAKKGDVAGGIEHVRRTLQIMPSYADGYLQLGVFLALQNQPSEAIDSFRKAIQLNYNSAPAHFKLGMLLSESGKTDEAMNHFNISLKLDPFNATAHYYLGLSFASRGKTDEAIQHFKEAIRIDPKDANSHFQLGKILAELGKIDQAEMEFHKTLKIDKKNANAHYYLGLTLDAKGKKDEAIQHFNEALRIDPKNANSHFGLGIALAGMGKIDEAEKKFNETLKIDPENANAHYYLGLSLIAKGKKDEATKHFNDALRIEPKNPNYHCGLGTLFAEMGKVSEAEKEFNEALKINPNYLKAYKELGNLMVRKGNYDESIRHFNKALQLDPHQPDVLNSLGMAFMYKGDIKKATSYYQESIREKPDNDVAVKNLTNARNFKKQLEGSVTMLQKSLKADPNNPVLHVKLAESYRQLGEYDQAKDHYQKAVSIQPNNMQAMYGLVLVYSDNQEYSKALDVLKKILNMKPGNPDVYYNIACIYAKQNMTDESVAWLKQSIQKGFHNWDMINKDPDLANIRNTPYVKNLMSSHPSS